jgi:CRISPR/Cas system endoribonuclease Cas6 (RAMP superfamily)
VIGRWLAPKEIKGRSCAHVALYSKHKGKYIPPVIQVLTPLTVGISLHRISDEKMYSDSNIIFVVFAGLGALLVVIPLPKALGE